MKTQTIEVEGLPEGWKAVAHRKPLKEEYILYGDEICKPKGLMNRPWLIVEKIQLRRIVLEETNEERRICFGEWYESQEGKLMRWPYGGKTDGKHKVWREVKETDIPLTNEDDKLSLSVIELKDISSNAKYIMDKIAEYIKDK